MTRNVQTEIKEVIDATPVISLHEGESRNAPMRLFCTGRRDPQPCDVEYATVDILQDPEVRQGIKVFSNWPTLPQLYIQGEFVGGCDIVTDMHLSGQLETMLEPVKG